MTSVEERGEESDGRATAGSTDSSKDAHTEQDRDDIASPQNLEAHRHTVIGHLKGSSEPPPCSILYDDLLEPMSFPHGLSAAPVRESAYLPSLNDSCPVPR